MPRRRELDSSQSVRGPLTALFDTQNAVPVIIRDLDGERDSWNSSWGRQEKFSPLFKRPRDYQDDHRLGLLHNDEARFMARVLLEPSRDPGQILQRQTAIRALSLAPNLEELVALKNEAYKVYTGAWEFLCYYGLDPNYWKAHEERLIRAYHQGVTEVPDFDDSGFGSVGTIEVKPIIEEGIDKADVGIRALEKLAGGLSRSSDGILPAVAQELTKVVQDSKRELDRDKLLTVSGESERDYWFYDKDRWDALDDFTHETVKHSLLRVGALVEFASVVHRDGWNPVTFDPTKPDFYLAGWNIERPKSSQVRNNSPEDRPIIIYSGANTSGKTFGMKADFLLRLSAQSLGLIPANGGNLRLHQAFAYLDRASTAHEQDLSAFMSEVKNWNAVLPHLVANTRLYVDEGFSTTSPDDQARLLLATAKYISGQGGSMVLASHNENLLRRSVEQANVGVYHLRSEVDATGRLERHFTLEPGPDDSKALAVAKARGFHPTVVEAAKKYLQGEQTLPAIERTPVFPDITTYTVEQRAQMKVEVRSLDQLFPESPEASIFKLFSSDKDFSPGNFLRAQTGSIDDGEAKSLFARMILYTPTLTPEQTLERQQLFTELLADERFKQISEVVRALRSADQSMAIIANSQTEGINKALYPLAIDPERKPDQKMELQERDLETVAAFLELNAKVLGDKFEHSALLEKIKGLKEMKDAHPLLDELEAAYKTLPAIKFQNMSLDSIQVELDALLEYRQGDRDTSERVSNTLQRRKQRHPNEMGDLMEMLQIAMGGLPRALKEYPSYQEGMVELVDLLRGTDSVYLHQTALLTERLFASMIDQVQTEQTQDSVIDLTADMGLFSFSKLGRRIDSFQGLPDTQPKKSPFTKELAMLDALCVGTSIVEAQKLSPVSFNSTGEVNLVNGFNLLKAKGVQVANSATLGGESSNLHILTGPNGSGKTFYEKGVAAAVLTGFATGHAPAESATMPIFDSVVYLDRVTKKVGRDLSAFANELVFWDKLVQELKDKNAVFGAVDEAFSTTSPLYQSALTYAAVGEFRRKGHYLLLSTHNHEVVEELATSDGGSIEPYHFSFDTNNGVVKYDYQIQKGHEGSHALEVAKTLGLKEEVIELAKVF